MEVLIPSVNKKNTIYASNYWFYVDSIFIWGFIMPRLKKVVQDNSLLELQKVQFTEKQKLFFSNMRGCWFDIVCYLSEEDIKMYLDSLNCVGYAYCVHDKKEDLQWHLEHEGELKKVHTHIVLCFERDITKSRPRAFKYAKMFNTTQIRLIKTPCQLEGSYLYLTHESQSAIKEGKVKYEKSKLVSNNFTFFENLSVLAVSNSALDIVDNLIAGVGYREMVARYGRDFVYHYKQYDNMARMIIEQERNKFYLERVED